MAKQAKESVTYQKMMTEVETILKEISNPEVDLDTLVEKVERGYTLIKDIKMRVNETKKKIEVLKSEFERSDQEALKP